MVFQNYALYPHMSVYDNMAYGLKIRGVSKRDIETRVQKAAKILELVALLGRKPRELSGGQRQRVAMGRAIVREPAAFLFDEPLSNLDAKLRVQMRLEIQKLHRELKTTSIFVTHDQVEAMTLANRMIVMNAGRVEQIGSPMEVYSNPASSFVAGFIGSPAMNLLPASLVGNLAPAGAQMVGVRPEHLLLIERPDTVPIAGSIEMVEALGADTLVHLRVGEVGAVIRLDGLVELPLGETLTAHAPRERLYWFGADGRRA
jgi:sn-glycerol 3-phosphate transport system ATP-binding protein